MILLLLSWVLLYGIFVSFGELTILLFNKVSKISTSEYDFLEKFWIGILFVVSVSIIFNFVFPLNIYIFGAFTIIGLIFCVYFKIPIKTYSKAKIFYSANKGLSFCFILIGMMLLLFSLFPHYIYDNALYHIQTMKWHQSYPVIKGLGNLHGRLAFNSTILLLSGLFNYQLGVFNTFTSIYGVCVLVLGAWILKKVPCISFISSLFLVLTYCLFIYSFSYYCASYDTDLLSALLVLILIFIFIFSEDRWSKPLVFFGLPFLCITFKISTLPICLFSLIYLIHYFKRKKTRIIISSIFIVSSLYL